MKRIACFLAITLTILALGGCSVKKGEKAEELIDLSASDEMMTYAQLFILTKEEREESIGKKIKVNGTCSTGGKTGDDISYYLMFFDGCCSYLTLDLIWNEDLFRTGHYPLNGDRILVTGTLNSYSKQFSDISYDIPCINVDECEILNS